ncbi:Polyprenol-phosphate-mannose-dependent alpha-(1-2)-phosphatidylinositol pentamannoside mannosyltransferase [Streptomyces hundungensis]|uniref:Polyprenol-phosphate-mannose-dependent alpha-(1-2)-phosphatidylinositol pentamannoside mannosyltransferase n=1 Tax=Streptomyces hundungensis TaxID=1077946 RepID=A0A387HKY5_9ACTN|nr:Polyprenol-phosphate-mannose-dependent alpha-(1-2)-phosphatidylinositol pentamannoside mannosyltransferase [Streptomyces hundungensis]
MTVKVLAHTAARFPSARRPLPLAAAVCLLSFALFWAAQRVAGVSMIDLMVYRAEGQTVRAGADLYAMRATEARLPTTYPPFAALLFTPLTLCGVPELRALATIANLGLLLALAHLSLRLAGRRRPGAALWVAALAVWCEPVWTTLRYGQINLLLAVAVLWDLTRERGHRWAGTGIGLAAAVKLTPALFALFLLIGAAVRARSGSGRDLLAMTVRAAAVFCAATVASAVVLPYDSLRFWTATVFEAGRVGHAEDTANQSLRGVLARLLHTGEPGPWWTVAAALTAALGLAVAVRAELRGERAWAVVACAVTALLVSPVSWSHHWVWCVPAVVLLVVERSRWALLGTVFCAYALWWVPHGTSRPELAQSGGQMALSALYPAAGAGLLVLAALRPWRRSRSASACSAPPGDGRRSAPPPAPDRSRSGRPL